MNRIEKLMKALPENADAAIITSDVNRRYFTGLGSSAGTLLAFRDAAYFIIDFRYIEVAKATVTGAEVILQDKLYEQLGELLKKHGAKTVAIETGYLTVGELDLYRTKLPECEFSTAPALNDAILEMRSLKDESEIAAIRKAQSITDAAFLEILDFIKPGKTEKEIAAYLEYCMRRLGADGLAFETIAAGGPNSAMPHAVPGDRPLQQGDFFTMDYGAAWGGYCSDMTRTVAIGEPTDEMRKVYETVLAAQLTGIGKAVAGVSCRAVDAAARDLILGWATRAASATVWVIPSASRSTSCPVFLPPPTPASSPGRAWSSPWSPAFIWRAASASASRIWSGFPPMAQKT